MVVCCGHDGIGMRKSLVESISNRREAVAPTL